MPSWSYQVALTRAFVFMLPEKYTIRFENRFMSFRAQLASKYIRDEGFRYTLPTLRREGFVMFRTGIILDWEGRLL